MRTRSPTSVLLCVAFSVAFVAANARAGDEPTAPVARTVEQLETIDIPWRESLVPAAMREATTFSLAVVPIAFPDRKPHPQATQAYWEDLFFARHEAAFAGDEHGSLADYYAQLSHGAFTVRGRVFAPVTIEATAAALLKMPMVNTGKQYREKALEALRARDGADALKGFGALCFIGAGDAGKRGRGLWPHRGKVEKIPYIQLTEGYRDEDLLKVGIPCHEFGHLFGFKDKYGLRNPRQGPGPWCLMGRGTHGAKPSGRDRPFSLCAWCKTQIGWLAPVTIDPRKPQRVRLRPVTHGRREAIRIPLKADGSEYYLLEVRAKRGLERDLPDEGLLIWHVGERKNVENFPVREYDVVLEPPHSRRVVDCATRYARWSCWPKLRQVDFTPDTHPSSRTRTPDAWPVFIRNIALPAEDGSVTFDVGPGPARLDMSLAPASPQARTLLAVLITAEGTEPPDVGGDRALRRQIDRMLYSQGEYFGPRRSLHGENVAGSLRDYVEEASGMHATVRGRRLKGTRGLWRVVPQGALGDPAHAVRAALPSKHGADGVIAFVNEGPRPARRALALAREEAGELSDGTPYYVVRCGDGRFGALGPLARWWVRTQYGPHIGPTGSRGCISVGAWRSWRRGEHQPGHPCVRCKLRWGWIDFLCPGGSLGSLPLRPVELFSEAWVSLDGTWMRQGTRGMGFFEGAPIDITMGRMTTVEETDYPEFGDVEVRVAALKEHPTVAVTRAGTTIEGRPILLVRVAGAGPLPADERPALFLTAALHGNEASTVPALLTWLEQLAEGGAPGDVTVYAMACVNADAYADFMRKPGTIWRPRGNKRPFDEDGDGKADEDGYDDLDGDGEIGTMRRKQADGTWKRFAREGKDADGDGKVAEDIPGGVDLNRNFPEGWRGGRGPFKLSRGKAPLSEPESRAVADALRARPNVALVIDVHNDADTLFVRLGSRAARGEPLEDHVDWPSYAPVIGEAGAVFGYEPRRMGRAGIFAAWAYEALGIPGTILEIGNGARERAPSTQDARKANAWSQEAFGVDGWLPWKPFKHPTLGDVEIGGDWKRFVKRNPPPGKPLGVVAARVRHFLSSCLDVLPRLKAQVTRTDAGGWVLRVENRGFMPTCTQRLAVVAPQRARLALTLSPGSLVSRVPDGWTTLSRNAQATTLVHAPLAAGGTLALPLHGVSSAEAVTATVAAAWPGGGARVLFKPAAAAAGVVKQVAMPEHRSHYVLHVPASYEPGKRVPLLVDLHGAAPVARNPAKISVAPWKGLCARHGFLHLLPQSRARAWGITEGDDEFIADCIGAVVKAYAVDPKRIWITGFSSGADYLPRFLLTHPKVFAAAAPLFPGSFPYKRGKAGLTPEKLKTIQHVPLLYVTGTADVRARTVREIVYTFRSLGLEAHMRVVPDVGHVFPPEEEYAAILRFFEGQRPAGDVLDALDFERKEVAGGHVVLPPAPKDPSAKTLVVLSARGAEETRPELRAYEAVRALAGDYRIVLPWRARGVDAAFLDACLEKARVHGSVLVYGHAGAAGALPALLASRRVTCAVASGPRADMRKALAANAPKKPVHILLGARAFDLKHWQPLLARWAAAGLPVGHDVLQGTRLYEPPAVAPLRRALASVLGRAAGDSR